MVGGIALLGVITASVASWFVERIGEANRAESEAVVKLDTLIKEVDALRTAVEETARPAAHPSDRQ
jgi:voltage-gated potassium channel